MKILLRTTLALLISVLAHARELQRAHEDPRKIPLLPTSCGIPSFDLMVGGENTVLGEFPWMALLEYHTSNGQQLLCGGFLISKRYVLTAAHCVTGLPPDTLLTSVRLGEHNTETNPDCMPVGESGEICADPYVSVDVEDVIYHEKYSTENDLISKNDIAIIRLKHDVRFTRFIKPICLPKDGELPSKYQAAGWGITEEGLVSTILLKLVMPSVDLDACQAKYAEGNNAIEIGEGQLCAGAEWAKGVCNGDSGGPLMSGQLDGSLDSVWTASGIVSFGHEPCGETGWPAVFTKVDDYYGWIISKLKP